MAGRRIDDGLDLEDLPHPAGGSEPCRGRIDRSSYTYRAVRRSDADTSVSMRHSQPRRAGSIVIQRMISPFCQVPSMRTQTGACFGGYSRSRQLGPGRA